MKISEITGMEGDAVMMQDLFEYVRTGTSPEGKVIGEFRPSGIRSFYTPRLQAAGLTVEAKLFEAN
jgi:pilus assembly protein CpaF